MIRWFWANDRWVVLAIGGVVFGLWMLTSSPWEWLVWAAG